MQSQDCLYSNPLRLTNPISMLPRSKAYASLASLLREADLIIEALPKRVRGRPKEQERHQINNKRDALCEMCNAYLKLKLGGRLVKADYEVIERSIKGSHGANTNHINSHFSLVGIPWITYENIGWQKKFAAGIRQELRSMASIRNRITHGANAPISEGRVRYWTGESLYLDLQINLKELPETIWQGLQRLLHHGSKI